MTPKEKEIHYCHGRKKPSNVGVSGAIQAYVLGKYLNCNNKANIFENGKWWCKIHAPSEVKKREEKKWNNYIKRLSQNNENI